MEKFEVLSWDKHFLDLMIVLLAMQSESCKRLWREIKLFLLLVSLNISVISRSIKILFYGYMSYDLDKQVICNIQGRNGIAFFNHMTLYISALNWKKVYVGYKISQKFNMIILLLL